MTRILTTIVLAFSKAIGLEPKITQAYNNRGNAYNEKGNLDQAIADFETYLRLDPNAPRPDASRAIAW
jgi:lipoprotein NlpI